MGNADRRKRDNEHRRHDHDGGQSWYRRAHIKVQLRSDDWPAPARLREETGQLRAIVRYANKLLQLRPGHCALGIVVTSEPAPWRLRRDSGLPAVQENCHRCSSDLLAGSIRLGGE